MKILSVDTSAKASSVSIVDENGTVAIFTINNSLTHSQTLMPMINAMLLSSGIDIGDIDAFACSNGPGSFTGLRIGIGAIKGLSYGTGKPCIGVSTLEALAYNLVGIDGIICPIMDARCNQVYTALFSSETGKITRLLQDCAVSFEQLEKTLENCEKMIIFVGDGANLCYNKFRNKFSNVILANDLTIRQNAASVGTVALKMISSGDQISADKLLPTYLRLPQAERELKERLVRKG